MLRGVKVKANILKEMDVWFIEPWHTIILSIHVYGLGFRLGGFRSPQDKYSNYPRPKMLSNLTLEPQQRYENSKFMCMVYFEHFCFQDKMKCMCLQIFSFVFKRCHNCMLYSFQKLLSIILLFISNFTNDILQFIFLCSQRHAVCVGVTSCITACLAME